MIFHRLISCKFPYVSMLIPGVCLMTSTHAARCAVREVYIAKGDILYNVEQLLFKKTKAGKVVYADNHTLSSVVSSADADDPNETAVPGALHVGTVTRNGNVKGGYKFGLRADITAKEGTYIVNFKDSKLSNAVVLSPPLTVKVREVAVFSISFLEGNPNGLGIRLPGDPSDTVVPTEAWVDGICNYPGAYVRGGTKKIRVSLHGPPNNICTVSATGTWDGIDGTEVTFDEHGNKTEFMTISNFPTKVTNGNVGWQWKSTR